MEMRKIGASGLEASALALGTWAIGGGSWWGDNDDQVSIESIHRANDGGITWIDTAPVYGFGHSEEVVGKAIQGRRDKVFLSTKCGLQWRDSVGTPHLNRDGHDVYRNLSAKSIRQDVEDSLRRLGTDYIDLLYTHWQAVEPVKTPVAETMDTLMALKKEGKIRAIGASNCTVEVLREYLKYGQLDAIQEKYSIVDRRIEAALVPFCREHKITVQTYSPLEQGLLTGKIGPDYQIRPGDTRETKPWWKPEKRAQALKLLEGWADLTQKYNCAMGNLIIAWTAAQGELFNVAVGARTTEQVAENLGAGAISLENSDVERMRVESSRIATMGD